MDPFVFDQRFARFAAQVDSQAMRRGAELYEQGAVTLRRVSLERIEGSVSEGRHGAYAPTLSDNGSGSFSGSCGCEEFFNCRHSYALARAARDQVVGRMVGDGGKPPAKPRTEPRQEVALAQAEQRLGRPPNREEAEMLRALDRLWKRLRASGYLLYPADLRPFARGAAATALPGQEPLRELKRMLPQEGAKDPLELGDALLGVLERRQLEPEPALLGLADSGQPRQRYERYRQSVARKRQDQPLRLEYRIRLEPADESDWYRARVELEAAGEPLTQAELRQLLQASGQPVRLEGKGWRSADRAALGEHESVLAALGLDPMRGNQQRVHATQVEALVPEALIEPADWQLVRERVEALEALEIPNPPEHLAAVLRPYQLDGFRFLCRLTQLGFGGILADDMGLGKTLQALTWLEWLYDQAKGTLRVLVICPKSVTENWMQEPSRFHCRLQPFLYAPGAENSPDYASAHLVVANYAQLRLHADRFLAERWDVAILDEGQYIKSPDSQTTQVAYQLNAGQRVILSGTPVENRLLDLWSLMRFVMPRLLGPRAAFLANYQSGRSADALEALRRRIRPFVLRRLKQQVATELPERIEKELRCELEGEQARLYRTELENARKALRQLDSEEASGASRINVLNTLLRLRQICCDPALIGAEPPGDGRSAKMQALLDLVEPLVEEGHKVLVFSQFVTMLDRIGAALGELGIRYQMLTGQTKDRGEQIRRFQSEEGAPVFLLSLKAAGSGLNLTAASYVVLFDPWWNPAVEAQAIDRTHRIGQRRQVIAYRLIAKDTVEEKIRQLQGRKAELADAVVDEAGVDAEGLSLDMIREALGSVP